MFAKVEATPTIKNIECVAENADYALVRDCVAHLSANWRDQPTLEELSRLTGRPATQLQKTFTRWAGLSPKAFLQALTLDHAKKLLDEDFPILDASYELGLSGPGRLHDLFVTHEAMSPGVYKAKGEGVQIAYGFHPCPFGIALVMATDQGMAGLAFCDAGGEAEALADMSSRWPKAAYYQDVEMTRPYAARSFDTQQWQKEQPLKVVLIGTDFEIRVWEGLLNIPLGKATSYSNLAASIGKPNAPRAVGRAVGRNPLSFVVPCHRVVGKSGALTGYHWGLTRKRAILGWEAGQASA